MGLVMVDSIAADERVNPPSVARVDRWYLLAALALILALMSDHANAISVPVGQFKEPWTLRQCDKLGQRAIAVFNVSIWSRGGWPLWKTICAY